MKLSTKYIPMGALPYENIDATVRMAAKLFDKIPYLPMLPKISEEETITNITLQNLPGVKIKDKKITLKVASTNYKNGLTKLDKAFNNPVRDNLEVFKIESAFMEKYFQMIKKFKPEVAIINLLGPFTISQILMTVAEEQMLVDKSFRKLFIQSVCVKALWAIDKIKNSNPDTKPLIILEEPLLGRLGDIKRENEEITIDLVTSLFARVIEKIKEHDAYVGVHCQGKCDWKIPINAGVDLISFDAFNNPNNLCIIPEQIIEFVSRGGKINWGIVPTEPESLVKSINAEYVLKRLLATMEGLVVAGVPEKFVYNSALVSVQGSTEKLPLIFAEKALILSTQIAKQIPHKS